MTKDELRNHCKKMCRRYSCIPDSSAYEEHKLVLDLLDTDDVLTKALVIQALEDVRSGIRERIEESVRKTWFEGSTIRCGMYEAIDIIDRKIKEIKHECSACTHSDEVDGEHCYECVKCDRDNFEANTGEELTNPFGDNSKIFGG